MRKQSHSKIQNASNGKLVLRLNLLTSKHHTSQNFVTKNGMLTNRITAV